jgi:heterotetrameric sarcosine oxidase delta subunit
MLLFDCPFCGPRDQSEFTYGREAAPIPALDAPREAWERYVFQRDNPRGPHREWWHHNHGCRRWLVVTRDTQTHAVLAVEEPDRPLPVATVETPGNSPR